MKSYFKTILTILLVSILVAAPIWFVVSVLFASGIQYRAVFWWTLLGVVVIDVILRLWLRRFNPWMKEYDNNLVRGMTSNAAERIAAKDTGIHPPQWMRPMLKKIASSL